MGLTRRDDTAATAATSRLNKVTQLTGFSDPVYAEAYVHVNQYDIVLDVLIVNQTGEKSKRDSYLLNNNNIIIQCDDNFKHQLIII